MPNPVWDVGLPPFTLSEDWQETPAPRFIETQMQGGAQKRRANPNPLPDQLSFSQRLSKAETQTLDTFYETILSNGVLPFDTTHPRKGVTATFQFVERPKISTLSSGVIWRAEYSLKIVP